MGSPWWVIATANCADTDDSLDHEGFVVTVGEFDLLTEEGTEQSVHIDKVYRHPYYASDLECDIALIRLAAPLTFDDNVQPIGLADFGAEFTGMCEESGWSQNAKMLKMQYGAVSPISTLACKGNPLGGYVSTYAFCGGNSPEDQSAPMCPGFTGSPLVCDGTLAGLQSFTEACGAPGAPTVYTKIGALRDWVDWVVAKYPDSLDSSTW